MQKESVEADLNKHFSRYEDPLWDEDEGEDRKKLYRVKLSLPRGSEKHKWKVYEDNSVVFVIDGRYLNKHQISYLLSPEGMNFILSSYKAGADNMNKFKKRLCEENVKNIYKK